MLDLIALDVFKDEALEFLDKRYPQQRFAATETHSAARGNEVKIIHSHQIVELLRCVEGQPFGRLETAMVETIAAVQPTAVKGSQSGDPLTVNPYAVAGYADERYTFHR